MRFAFTSTLVVALAAQGTIASTWFGKAVYNKWHQTELERWLEDHNVPYPQPADRKDLENLVKKNWNDRVVTPYNSWDTQQLQSYLALKGQEAKDGTKQSKDTLIQQIKNYWTETEDTVAQAYANVRDWIFDTWTESQLKAFCDRHGIPVPQPRTRDTYLKAARENYQSIANKAKETYSYPGNWLYDSWSDSDLKAWLDERGYPVPQPTSRDKLIASVRRNSRLASLNMQAASASASASASAALQNLSDKLIDSWSDSQIKEWCDKNNIKVPQGSKRNELIALVCKHRAELLGDSISASAKSASKAASASISSASKAASASGASAYGHASASGASAYGAATSKAGNEYAQATNYFAGATDWLKAQVGFGTAAAKASASSATVAAGKSASSASARAGKSSASASSAASKSASSASSRASKSGASASGSASNSVHSAYDAAASKAAKASKKVKEEL